MADNRVAKRGYYYFREHTNRVLKQVHPDTGMTEEARDSINFMMVSIAARLIRKSVALAVASGAKTVTSRDLQSIVRTDIGGELGKHAVSEGTKAVTKATTSAPAVGGRVVPREKRAGLVFSVGVTDHIVDDVVAGSIRKGGTFPVYLSAALEYLCAEIVQLAGNAARDHRAKRLTNRFLFLAIRNDEELHTYLMLKLGIEMENSGVIPNIYPELLEKKPKAKKKKREPAAAEPEAEEAEEPEANDADEEPNANDANEAGPVIRKPHRFRAGTRSLMDIRKLQKTKNPLLALENIRRAFKEIASDHAGGRGLDDILLAKGVPELLRSALEAHLIDFLDRAQVSAIHAGRVLVQTKDVHLAMKLASADIPIDTNVYDDRNPFTTGAFNNLCHRAGVKTHASDLAHTFREVGVGMLDSVAFHLVEILANQRRKKATLEATVRALKLATGKVWLPTGVNPKLYTELL